MEESVLALIEYPAVVRTILAHQGRWEPEAVEPAPPVPLGAVLRA